MINNKVNEDGVFCQKHSKHSISSGMWCEEKKRLIEKNNAEESLRLWRRRKAEEFARKERDKKEFQNIYANHCPWGRPGGGAPNIDIRRKDITELGLHYTPPVSTSLQRYSTRLHLPCQFGDYVPKQYKQCIDSCAAYPHFYTHHSRYHNNNYHHSKLHYNEGNNFNHTAHDLNTDNTVPLINGNKLTAFEDITLDCKYQPNGETIHKVAVDLNPKAEHLQIAFKDHPIKSCCNKTHLNIEVRYKPIASKQSKPKLEKIFIHKKSDNKFCTNPVRSNTGSNTMGLNAKTLSQSDKQEEIKTQAKLNCSNNDCSKDLDQDNPVTPAEKPILRKSRNTNKKLSQYYNRCNCTCISPCRCALNLVKQMESLKIINKSMDIKKKTCKRLQRHNNKANVGSNTTDQSVYTRSTSDGNKCSLDDTMPLLAKRQLLTHSHPINLSSTDATKCITSKNRAIDGMRYIHELGTQIVQRRHTLYLNKQIDQEQCNKHFRIFDTFWGRPGHGAPGEVIRKLNLHSLLYGANN